MADEPMSAWLARDKLLGLARELDACQKGPLAKFSQAIRIPITDPFVRHASL